MRLAVGFVASLLSLLSGCDESVSVVENDGSSRDAAPDRRADADGRDVEPGEAARPDAVFEAGGEPEPGPLTLVLRRGEVVTDRLCDIDGDGREDSAVAELGAPTDSLFANILNQFIAGRIDEAGHRLVMHMPWVDDVRRPHDPEVFPIMTPAVSGDDDLSDDFSGYEMLFARCDWEECMGIDGCGEPRHLLEDAGIEQGELSVGTGTMVLPGISIANVFRAWGTIEPMGASATLSMCAFHTIAELGATFMIAATGGRSALEVLLYGGAVYGVPTVPGLVPDLDFDGDGLERFVLSDEGFILSCVDGDTTEIPGGDCWTDPRMADGFSLNTRFTLVSAVFGGLQPSWEVSAREECSGGPPAESLWDPR